MANIFHNHLLITGPVDRLDEIKKWCNLNEDMIDVDDGASDAANFDEAVNYDNHKEFIAFIESETETRVDRIRLHSRGDSGLLLCLDSWSCRFSSHTCWMHESFPALKFELSIIDSGYSSCVLIFVDAKWIAYIVDLDVSIEEDEDPPAYFHAAGYVGDFSDQKLLDGCDRDSLDPELRAFVDGYQLTFPDSPWVKLQKEAEEEIRRWGE